MTKRNPMRNLLLGGFATACLLATAGVASAAGYGGAPIKSPYASYDAALQQRYQAMSEMEGNESDSSDAWSYGNKAIAARDGFLVLPDDPANHKLNAEQRAFARPVYTHLLNAYLAGVPETATTDMADAQVNFDCWMNDIEDGKNAARAQVCHTNLVAILTRLSGPDAKVPATVRADAMRAASVASSTASLAKGESVSHRLLFKFDSAALDGDAAATRDHIVRLAVAYPRSIVHVTGHTDRAGSAEYNHALAQKRAANVAVALGLRGLLLDRIDEVQMGESDLAVVTRDGVAEAENRRVVITV
ncbi:MAG: OmpA family protein, partial [Paracoccaceae bacterium]|nr:OmpA family protein [Paracoccaceae bacterium]